MSQSNGNERFSQVFTKDRWAKRSKAEKRGVGKKKGRPLKRKLLVLGTGRSGSTFIHRLFRIWGYDLGHEQTGEFGSVTHFFHADHDWYPYFPWEVGKAHVGERLSDFNFENKLHVVRNPLTCIPSIEKVLSSINWEFAEETGLIPAEKMSKRRRCMLYWLRLNERAEAICHKTIQLEKLRKDLPKYLGSVDILHGEWPELPPVNRGTGFRASEPVTFSELRREDKDLANQIFVLSKHYGY